MLTSTSGRPASTKRKVWTRKNSTKLRKCLVWVKKGKRSRRSLRVRKEKAKIRKARGQNIAPLPGPQDTSNLSARTAGEATAAGAVLDGVPCVDAAITRRGACPQSATC